MVTNIYKKFHTKIYAAQSRRNYENLATKSRMNAEGFTLDTRITIPVEFQRMVIRYHNQKRRG